MGLDKQQVAGDSVWAAGVPGAQISALSAVTQSCRSLELGKWSFSPLVVLRGNAGTVFPQPHERHGCALGILAIWFLQGIGVNAVFRRLVTWLSLSEASQSPSQGKRFP